MEIEDKHLTLEGRFERDFREYLNASIAFASVQQPYQALSSEDEIIWLKKWIQKNLTSALTSDRLSLVEWAEGMMPKLPTKPCLNAEMHTFGKCFNCENTKGYRQALTDIISRINSLHEEHKK